MMDFLKPLFSSKTRVKLLKLFFENPDQERYVREITRDTDEQINSIRRELENLEKINVFVSRSKTGKKYFHLNKGFVFFPELYSMFQKVNTPALEFSEQLKKMGKKIDLVILTGKFIGKKEEIPIDIFIVGDISREKIDEYIQKREDSDIRFALLSRADFLHRVKQKDSVLKNIFSYDENIIPLNLIPELL